MAAAAAAVSLGACATLPPDGHAVNCAACRTMWIRLLPVAGVTGYYRAKCEQAGRPCTTCEKLALDCFRGDQLPARCPRCGGELVVIPVNIAR